MFDKLKSKFGGGSSFDANTQVRITQEGADAVVKDQIASTKQRDIMNILYEHSPKSLSTLSKESQINNVSVTREEVAKLKQAKLLQLVED